MNNNGPGSDPSRTADDGGPHSKDNHYQQLMFLMETHLYRNIYCNAVSNTLYCTSFSLSRAFDYYPAVFFNGMTRDHYACVISAYCSKY